MHTTGCSVDWEKISLTSCIGSQLIDEKVAFPFRTMTGLIYSSFMFFTFWQWGSLSLHRSFQTCKPYRHHRVDAVCSTQVSSHCCRYVTFLDIVNNYTGGKLYISWNLPVNLYTRPICMCIPIINTTYLKILFIDESLDPLNHTLMLAVSKTQPDGWYWGVKFPIHIVYIHHFARHFLIGYQHTVCWHCLSNQ